MTKVTYLANGLQDSSGCIGAYSLFYVEQSFLGHYGCMQIIPSNVTQSMDDEIDVVMQDDQMPHVDTQCVTGTSEEDTIR
jgi:hypothetical protein